MSDIVCDSPVGFGPYFEEDDPDAEERGLSFDSSVRVLGEKQLVCFRPLVRIGIRFEKLGRFESARGHQVIVTTTP
jgi:hypothetical protein